MPTNFDFRCSSQAEIVGIIDELETVNFTMTATAAATDAESPFMCETQHGFGLHSQQLLTAPSVLNSDEWQQTADALTVEVWFTPPSTNFTQLPAEESIFAIGRAPYTPQEVQEQDLSTAEELDWIGCQGYFFYMAQVGKYITMRYEDNDPALSCRALVVRQQELVPNHLHHVALVLKAGETALYFNGRAIFEGARNYFTSDDSAGTIWGRTNKTVAQFFGSTFQMDDMPFRGSIRNINIHPRAFNHTTSKEAFHAGLDQYHIEQYEAKEKALAGVHVQAFPSLDDLRFVQGQTEETVFEVGSFNSSSIFLGVGALELQLLVEIVAAPMMGSLSFVDETRQNRTIEIGSVITFPLDDMSNVTSIAMQYSPSESNYFNAPRTTFSSDPLPIEPDSFSYRLVALVVNEDDPDFGGRIAAKSEPVHQPLLVVHVNHPPALIIDEIAEVPEKQQTGISAKPTARLANAELADPDYDIDRVRVRIHATNGTLSIMSDEIRNMADFESCADRSNWYCYGKGVEDRSMSFVAVPSHVQKILDNLEFKGFGFERQGLIEVDIWDGSGGSCLNAKEHAQRPSGDSGNDLTIHPGCFHEAATIYVPAISRLDSDAEVKFAADEEFVRAFFDLDDFGTPDIIFWSSVGFLLLFCCLGISYCHRCFCAPTSMRASMHSRLSYGSSSFYGKSSRGSFQSNV